MSLKWLVWKHSESNSTDGSSVKKMEMNGRSELDADDATRVDCEICGEKLPLHVTLLVSEKSRKGGKVYADRRKIISLSKDKLHPIVSEWANVNDSMVVKHAHPQVRPHPSLHASHKICPNCIWVEAKKVFENKQAVLMSMTPKL